jgi:hypothetical protein
MSDVETTATVSPAGCDPETYNDFIRSLALLGVDVVKVSGERRAAGESSQTAFDLEVAYQLEDQMVRYWFQAKGRLTDEEKTNYGEIAASVVVTLRSTQTPSPACIERFGATSAAMIAHPYLREAIATTAQRLGFLGVLLPLLTQHPDSETATIQDADRIATP